MPALHLTDLSLYFERELRPGRIRVVGRLAAGQLAK